MELLRLVLGLGGRGLPPLVLGAGFVLALAWGLPSVLLRARPSPPPPVPVPAPPSPHLRLLLAASVLCLVLYALTLLWVVADVLVLAWG